MDDDNNASSLVDFASSLDEALGYSNDGSCAYIDCRNCAYRPEGGRWLCTGCVRDGRSLPYWTDGACDSCGGYSIVLALEVP